MVKQMGTKLPEKLPQAPAPQRIGNTKQAPAPQRIGNTPQAPAPQRIAKPLKHLRYRE